MFRGFPVLLSDNSTQERKVVNQGEVVKDLLRFFINDERVVLMAVHFADFTELALDHLVEKVRPQYGKHGPKVVARRTSLKIDVREVDQGLLIPAELGPERPDVHVLQSGEETAEEFARFPLPADL